MSLKVRKTPVKWTSSKVVCLVDQNSEVRNRKGGIGIAQNHMKQEVAIHNEVIDTMLKT